MSTRAGAWLAWALCVLSLALTALSLLLLALNPSHSVAHPYDYWLENTVQAVSFSIIGAILASRLPANPLGWLFCAAACLIAVVHFSGEYAIYALLARPALWPESLSDEQGCPTILGHPDGCYAGRALRFHPEDGVAPGKRLP